MTPVFLILAVLTLAGAGAAMTLRKLVHSALALIAAFAGLGALYLCLGAQFIGLAQWLVYVGAIAVLIVFAILLTHGADAGAEPSASRVAGVLVASAVFAVLAWAICHSFAMHVAVTPSPRPTVTEIGTVLMNRYIMPLEVIGLMLTAALIGAVILALKERRNPQ